MRRIWVTIAQTSGARIYSLLASLVVLFLTARWLGPDGRGTLAAAVTWAQLFFILGFFSLNQVAIQKFAGLASDRERMIRPVVGAMITWAIVASVFGWAAGLTLRVLFPSWFSGLSVVFLATALLLIPFFIWEQYANALLMLFDRVHVYNRAQIGSKTALLLMVLLVWLAGGGVMGVIVCMVLAQATLALWGTPAIRAEVREGPYFDRNVVFEMIKNGLKLHPGTVGTFAQGYASVLIIHGALGASATGLFQLALQLTEVMLVVPYSASIVVYSRIGQVGALEAWREQRTIVGGVTLAMVVGCGVAAALAPWGIVWLAGAEFVGTVPLFRWLLIGVVFTTFSTLVVPQWIGAGRFWQLSVLTLSVAVVNLGMNATLVPRMGPSGAVVAALTAQGITAAAHLVFALGRDRELRETREPVHDE